MTPCYLGFGSNLGDSRQHILTAWEHLGQHPEIQILTLSSLYKTKPMGPQDQPDFLNAVGLIETSLEPHALLAVTQQLELAQGRVKTRHWGERTLDIDILLFGELTLNSPDLVIPHPGICEREFVLKPLLEIAPRLVLPNGQ